MPADINDHNQLPAVLTTQVTPTAYNTPGALTTVTSINYLAQPVIGTFGLAGPNFAVSTQDNNQAGVVQGNTFAWGTAVATISTVASYSPGAMNTGNLAVVVSILATPTNSPGVMGTGNLVAVTAQISTQVNPSPSAGLLGGLSNVQAEQQLAVVGQVYNSPGGILNKAAATGTATTGGGP